MLKSIRLKFGPTPTSEPIQFAPGAMTVIVGPNNSGKSLMLQELARSLNDARSDWQEPDWKLLADIEPALPVSGKLREHVLKVISQDLAPLRCEDDSDVSALNALATILGKEALRDDIDRRANWTSTLKHITSRTQSLIGQKRINPPHAGWISPEYAVPSDDPALAERLTELVKWSMNESLSTLEFIFAVNERSDEALIEQGLVDLHGYYKHYKGQCTLLDGQTRLRLADDESCGSLHQAPAGTIMRLWHNREHLEQLRRQVLDAFGQHLCVDIMNMGYARLVLSERAPPPGLEDRLDAEARQFINAAHPLHEFSDGVRTYIGLHAALIAQDHRFVMIDEPEAFLHPPLARRLGFNLSTLAAERGSCVFAATHSPDFLMGCIESGVGVNIVRLGYHNGRPSAHLLPRDELQTMMVDPLLRSTGILGALFHQAAVVVEGDSDRAFYGEINERLRLHDPTGHPAIMRDCVFLNAQGKATVSRILAALRRLGVVSCGIVDLDLLKDNKVCTNLVRARGAPESVCLSIGYTRSQIERSVGDLADACKPNGLARASVEERRSVQHFIREMELHGVFLPEVGQVEGWLADLGVEAHKGAWIPRIFEAMGPVTTGLKPGRGDVWQFIRRIGRFLDEQRSPAETGASGPASS